MTFRRKEYYDPNTDAYCTDMEDVSPEARARSIERLLSQNAYTPEQRAYLGQHLARIRGEAVGR